MKTIKIFFYQFMFMRFKQFIKSGEKASPGKRTGRIGRQLREEIEQKGIFQFDKIEFEEFPQVQDAIKTTSKCHDNDQH